jgi:hypothetical protein
MNSITKHDYYMLQDGMLAIRKCELEAYFRDQEVIVISDPNSFRVSDAMEYKLHSGSSFSWTLRGCQYYLNNADKWVELCKAFS